MNRRLVIKSQNISPEVLNLCNFLKDPDTKNPNTNNQSGKTSISKIEEIINSLNKSSLNKNEALELIKYLEQKFNLK